MADSGLHITITNFSSNWRAAGDEADFARGQCSVSPSLSCKVKYPTAWNILHFSSQPTCHLIVKVVESNCESSSKLHQTAKEAEVSHK